MMLVAYFSSEKQGIDVFRKKILCFGFVKEKDKIKLRLEGVDINDFGSAIIVSTI